MPLDTTGWTREQKIARLEKLDRLAKLAPETQEPGVKAIGVTDGPTPAANEKDWTDAEIPGTHISARSVGQGAANSLPVVGAMTGATAAGVSALPATLGVGTVPAAFAGSMAGGAVGNSLKKTLENYFNKQNPHGYKASISKQLLPDSLEEAGQNAKDSLVNIAEGARTGLEAELGGQVFNKVAPAVLPYLASQFAGIPEQAIRTYMEHAPAVMKMALESKGPKDIMPNIGRASDRIRQAIESKTGAFRKEQSDAIGKVLQRATTEGATHDLGPTLSALESGRLSVPEGTNPSESSAINDTISQIGAFPRVKAKVIPQQSEFAIGDDLQKGVRGPRGVDLNGPQETMAPQQSTPDELQRQLGFGPVLNPANEPIMPAPGNQVEMPGGRPATTQGLPTRPVDPLTMPRGNGAAVEQLERQLADHDAEARLMFAQRPSEYRTGQLERLNTHRQGLLEEIDKAQNQAGPQQRYLSQRLTDAIAREGEQMGISGTGILPKETALTSGQMIRTEKGQMPLFEETSPWSSDASHVTPQTLYDVKKRLQGISQGEGAYVAPGTMFNKSGESAKTARAGAAQARATLHTAYPEIAEPDTKLANLHHLDYNMPASLHSEGTPTGGLVAAGAGTNPMNRNHLEDLGNLTGNDFLGEAQRLAAVQHFGHPKLLPEYPTGKAILAMSGGPLASPRLVKKMIDLGMFDNPTYARALTPGAMDAAGNILSRIKNPWATAQEGQ